MITFLDDCVQRCVKTPYKYVEELQALYSTTTIDADVSAIGTRPEAFPSPLLATVIEQLGAKLRGRLLTPSDALALVTFVRKLLVLLVGKTSDLALTSALVQKISSLLMNPTMLFSERTTVEAALTREMTILKSSLQQLQNPIKPKDRGGDPHFEEYMIGLQERLESEYLS